MSGIAERDARIRAALDAVEDTLTSWALAQLLGEPSEELGYAVHDQLEAMSVSELARAVVILLGDIGRHHAAARRILEGLRLAEEWVAPRSCLVCGKPVGAGYEECLACYVTADDAYRRGQDR